jgi:hypothetical protein
LKQRKMKTRKRKTRMIGRLSAPGFNKLLSLGYGID